MIATDLAPRHPAVNMDLQTLAEEMMTIATGQPRSPAVVMAPVATMTTAMARSRSPAAAMVPPATMKAATAQLRSPAAVMVPVATMMTIMDQGPRHLAVDTDLQPLAVATMMTVTDREPRHPGVDTDLRPLAVETIMTTAMAPPRSLVADMAVETMIMTATALETNPAAAAMAPETLLPLTTRQATHLVVIIGMIRAVCR